jgi:ParB family chromosome partitioning protein
MVATIATSSTVHVPVERIRVGNNPRKRFEEESIAGLAQSIKSRGQHQPIIVEADADGWYELVSGERRLRATKLNGSKTIEAVVRGRTNHNGRERFLDALLENDQREDMTPMELANAYLFLQTEYGMSVRDISKEIGKSEATIGNLLVLTKLDPEIQEMIEDGLWKDPRFVRGLLTIANKEARIKLAEHLWSHRVSLKGCLKAVGDYGRLIGAAKKKERIQKGTPSMVLSGASFNKPTGWDMLKQLGQAPEWNLVVKSAERTCEQCPLRGMASRSTCSDCGAVTMLRTMMEMSHARNSN